MTGLAVTDLATRPRARWPFWLAGVIVTVAVVVGTISAFDRAATEPDLSADQLWFEVRPGPLTISLSATGALKAKDQVVIRNELPGRNAIVSIVAEGTIVKKGDLLVELDSSKVQNDLIDQQIKVNSSNADVTKAEENLAVVKNQVESDLVKADADLRDARINQKKYLEGEYRLAEHKAKAALALAQSNLKQATEKATWSKRLADEGYITATDAAADQAALDKNDQDLKTAEIDLELLQQYTREQQISTLADKLKQADLAVERSKRKGSADIVQAEADLSAKRTENERQKSKLEKLNQQVASTKVFAPVDGVVVYPNPRGWGQDQGLAAGVESFERQEMLWVPTSDSIIANVQVPEVSVSRLRAGLPVHVSIEALPGDRLDGKIARVAQFPSRENDWLNRDLKLYAIEISIDGVNPDLRPGMSCQVEMIIQQLDNVVYVPVQTVVKIGDQHVVYVAAEGQTRRRPIKIGLDNNRMVHVLEGLKAGDKVLLSPPLEQAPMTGNSVAGGSQ